jgi:hypothetical protein
MSGERYTHDGAVPAHYPAEVVVVNSKQIKNPDSQGNNCRGLLGRVPGGG